MSLLASLVLVLLCKSCEQAGEIHVGLHHRLALENAIDAMDKENNETVTRLKKKYPDGANGPHSPPEVKMQEPCSPQFSFL